MVVPLEMLAEQPDQEWRQGDDSGGGRGFGCAEPAAVATFVQGAGVWIDGDGAVVEVDVVAVQSG